MQVYAGSRYNCGLSQKWFEAVKSKVGSPWVALWVPGLLHAGDVTRYKLHISTFGLSSEEKKSVSGPLGRSTNLQCSRSPTPLCPLVWLVAAPTSLQAPSVMAAPEERPCFSEATSTPGISSLQNTLTPCKKYAVLDGDSRPLMCHKVHECQGVSVLHAVYGQKQSSVIAISLEEEQAQSQEIQKKSRCSAYKKRVSSDNHSVLAKAAGTGTGPRKSSCVPSLTGAISQRCVCNGTCWRTQLGSDLWHGATQKITRILEQQRHDLAFTGWFKAATSSSSSQKKGLISSTQTHPVLSGIPIFLYGHYFKGEMAVEDRSQSQLGAVVADSRYLLLPTTKIMG
ncbi:hypothetical protein Anapl_12923 [Anas platyrhynchos]|uniref:Uncharacterized protein n=1 Tax=Anas platyrhynchos TaxID=8839 RepID=R0JXC5_ANAPL|nr:hypothetical protein Anapl_12923 [Anas platyrhynchos]